MRVRVQGSELDKTQVYSTRHENLYGVFFRSGFCNFAVTLHGRVIV